MELGAFSISLTVKDLEKSKAFYKKLGFVEKHPGAQSEHWTVLANGEHVIGLFQGMFDKNILTFNPGWNQQAENLDSFTDVRDLQKALKADGIELVEEVDENGSGPGHITMVDPDGNPILIDQHR